MRMCTLKKIFPFLFGDKPLNIDLHQLVITYTKLYNYILHITSKKCEFYAFVIIGHNSVARCFLGAIKSKVKCVCGGIGPTHACFSTSFLNA
jgi:hypothetical protein